MHLQQCSDCEGRHRAFRRHHGIAPAKPIDLVLKQIVDATTVTAPSRMFMGLGPALVESYARLVLATFANTGEDEETELWRAWRGTHFIARAVHHAKRVQLSVIWIAALVDACVTALLFAVLQVKRRWTFDTAWPVVECLSEGVAAVSTTPRLRKRYALAYARFVREAPDPIRGLLVWRLADIAHHPADEDDIAVTVIQDLSGSLCGTDLEPILAFVLDVRPSLGSTINDYSQSLIPIQQSYAARRKAVVSTLADVLRRSEKDSSVPECLLSVLTASCGENLSPNDELIAFIDAQQALRQALTPFRDARNDTRRAIVQRFQEMLFLANESFESPFIAAAACEIVRRLFPHEWASALPVMDGQLSWQQRQALVVTSAKTCESARMASRGERTGLLPCMATSPGTSETERCTVWYTFERCNAETANFAPHMAWLQDRFGCTAPAACPQWTPVHRESVTAPRRGTRETDVASVRPRRGTKSPYPTDFEVHPS